MNKDWPLIKETYCFDCTLCGECCRGDMEVMLNPHDLYKMAVFAGLRCTDDLFEKNLVELVPGQHGMPVPTIRFRKVHTGFCPFLSNELTAEGDLIGTCMLHPDHKPLVCAMAPVAREVDLKSATEVYRLADPVLDCPGMSGRKENFLTDLKKHYNLELDFQERYFRLLEMLKHTDLNTGVLTGMLYFFPVQLSFEEVWSSIENHPVFLDFSPPE